MQMRYFSFVTLASVGYGDSPIFCYGRQPQKARPRHFIAIFLGKGDFKEL
jgi:hypothetical protein